MFGQIRGFFTLALHFPYLKFSQPYSTNNALNNVIVPLYHVKSLCSVNSTTGVFIHM